MKKLSTLILSICLVALMTNVYGQKDRTLSNGFSVKVVTGLPFELYGTDVDLEGDIPSEFTYGMLFGMQIGNQWYISPSDNFGFAINVNWVDFTIAKKKVDLFEMTRRAIDFTFIEVGPLVTYALSDEIAIDGYYNLRPTLLMTAQIYEGDDDADASIGFGFSHAIGANFRWNVLSVGAEFVGGGINSAAVDSEDVDKVKLSTSSLRFLLGVKF